MSQSIWQMIRHSDSDSEPSVLRLNVVTYLIVGLGMAVLFTTVAVFDEVTRPFLVGVSVGAGLILGGFWYLIRGYFRRWGLRLW